MAKTRKTGKKLHTGKDRWFSSRMEIELRLKACAYIVQKQREERIAEIAEKLGVSIEKASLKYTGGIVRNIKRMLRVPYREALTVLEDRQAGERVWRTVPTAHTMALWRIEDMNRTPVVPTRPGFIVSPDGEAVAHTFMLPELPDAPPNRSAHSYYNRIAGDVRTAIEEIKNGHTVPYEAAEERARAKVAREDNVDAILARHLEAYIASQGRIANTSACELINTDIPVDRICAREAANNPYVKRLYHAMTHLHRCWAHKNAISARDMLSLMRRYLRTDGGGVHV